MRIKPSGLSKSCAFELKENIPTDIKKVTPLVRKISHKIHLLNKSTEEIFKIKLSLEEALTNAMIHGNKLDKDKEVAVRVKAGKKNILIDVRDEGKGFNFRRVPDPTKGKNVNLPSGRGIFLMRHLMNKVEFYDKGRGVKMSYSFTPNHEA